MRRGSRYQCVTYQESVGRGVDGVCRCEKGKGEVEVRGIFVRLSVELSGLRLVLGSGTNGDPGWRLPEVDCSEWRGAMSSKLKRDKLT